ncbi:MAG: hypothetical protein J2P16_01940 [Mycobacterium sp.]|nr:hypothetical protein [Mycobacterium sp.]
MPATSLKPRLTRLAILVVASATALSVAACGSSNKQNTGKPATSTSSTTHPTSSAPKPPPAPPVGKDHIEGMINSVSGNTIHLTQRDRTAATVDFTPETMITEVSSAALSDVTPGSCVEVKAGPESGPPGSSITAQSVEISPAEGGACLPPVEAGPGSGGTPPAAPPSGEPAESPGVSGMVSSVTGNTIAVSSTDPTGKTTQTDVTVIETTTYVKHTVTNPQAIQQGKCMAAQGTESGGVLQATMIDLEPCPAMGRPHHHFYLPHLPHHHHHH